MKKNLVKILFCCIALSKALTACESDKIEANVAIFIQNSIQIYHVTEINTTDKSFTLRSVFDGKVIINDSASRLLKYLIPWKQLLRDKNLGSLLYVINNDETLSLKWVNQDGSVRGNNFTLLDISKFK